jgi:hypothetical protein
VAVGVVEARDVVARVVVLADPRLAVVDTTGGERASCASTVVSAA